MRETQSLSSIPASIPALCSTKQAQIYFSELNLNYYLILLLVVLGYFYFGGGTQKSWETT